MTLKICSGTRNVLFQVAERRLSDNASNILTYRRREKTYTVWGYENCQASTNGKEWDGGKSLFNLVIVESGIRLRRAKNR